MNQSSMIMERIFQKTELSERATPFGGCYRLVHSLSYYPSYTVEPIFDFLEKASISYPRAKRLHTLLKRACLKNKDEIHIGDEVTVYNLSRGFKSTLGVVFYRDARELRVFANYTDVEKFSTQNTWTREWIDCNPTPSPGTSFIKCVRERSLTLEELLTHPVPDIRKRGKEFHLNYLLIIHKHLLLNHIRG